MPFQEETLFLQTVMKRLLVIIFTVAASLAGFAQSDSTATTPPAEESLINAGGCIPTPLGRGWGWAALPWLHQGLNVKLDLSAFATFGQSLSATWLQPVNDKLWVAAGGRVNNIIYGGDSYRDGSLYVMAGYRFNERWSAYVYAEKNITNNHGPRFRYDGYGFYGPDILMYHFGAPPFGGVGGGYYDMMPADRIGAAVRYNFSPTFSMEVSVEGVWPKYDRIVTHPYQYNYPIRENY